MFYAKKCEWYMMPDFIEELQEKDTGVTIHSVDRFGNNYVVVWERKYS